MRSFAFLLGLLCVVASQAEAQPLDTEAVIHQGVELRRQHRDAEALTLFQRLYASNHSPRALAQVGLAEQALGRWVEAETHVVGALGGGTDPWISRNAAALHAAVEAIGQHLGNLWIDGLAGAQVLADGRPVATLPMRTAARVVAGSVNVEVRAEGRVSVSRRVDVPQGGEVRENVTLLPRENSPLESSEVILQPPRNREIAEDSSHPGETQRAFAWVSAVGAALIAGGGFVALGFQMSWANDYNDDMYCPGTSPDNIAVCQNRLNQESTFRVLATVGFATAGALAITSLLLFLTAPSRPADVRSAQLGCGVGLSLLGVSCIGRF